MKKTKKTLPVAYDPISRRMFLRGTGGLLAIPVLSSITPNAFAQSAPRNILILANTTHGYHQTAWYPHGMNLSPVAGLTNVRRANLVQPRNAQENANWEIGHVIGNQLDFVRSKISVLQGLDLFCDYDHYGFPWNASGSINRGGTTQQKFNPAFNWSVDGILERSSGFYATPPPINALRIDPRVSGSAAHTYSWSGGNTPNVAYGATPQNLWNLISPHLNKGTVTPTPPMTGVDPTNGRRKFLVDLFAEQYRSLASSGMLSTEDRHSFNNFADQLADVSRTLPNPDVAPPVVSNPGSTTANCAATVSQTFTSNDEFNTRLIDMMTLAIACNVTSLGMYHLNWDCAMVPPQFDAAGNRFTYLDSIGDRYSAGSIHENIHAVGGGNGQSELNRVTESWRFGLKQWAKIVSGLEKYGLLDQSLVVFTSDRSNDGNTHRADDMPVVTAGSMNGKFRTGEMISYYNTGAQIENPGAPSFYFKGPPGFNPVSAYGGSANRPGTPKYAGILYNHFLTTLLQAAGANQSSTAGWEYEKGGRGAGFGQYFAQYSATGPVKTIVDYHLARVNSGNYDKNATLPYWYKG